MTQGSAPHIWRYVPTPARRAAGWASVTLLNPDKTHMTKGQALDAAEAINRLIDDYEAGIPVQGQAWAHLNPNIATGITVSRAASDSIGALMTAYIASDEFRKGLSEATRNDMAGVKGDRGRLYRLIETLAGYKEGCPQKRDFPPAAYERAMIDYNTAIERTRNWPVSALVPPRPKAGEGRIKGPLELAYANLAGMINERTGKPQITQAAAILRYTSMWLSWVKKEKGFIDRNPVQDIDVTEPEGRIAIWPQDRIEAVLTEARRQGWHSVAFACELALELSWSQRDILKLKWGDIRDGRILGTRSKTGIKTETTLTAYGLDIIARIRDHYTRENGENVTALPTQHLIRVDKRYGHEQDSSVGQVWARGYFRHIFREIRDAVFAGYNGTTYTFQDFRDTAITRMWEAGLDFPQIASRSQHSLAHIQKVIEKHYGKITRTISDAAAEKMNAYNARSGIFKT